MLTRKLLGSATYLDCPDWPADLLWSRENIDQSLRDALEARPDDGPVWIFAYGSLMWNPLLNVDRQETARLDGWRRSFCLRMVAGRGSVAAPGRMLAVEQGGSTQALAMRLAAGTQLDDLTLLWTREMVLGAYVPMWLPIRLAGGSTVRAMTFVANTGRPQYQPDSSIAAIIRAMSHASGPLGSNAEYVFKLEEALRRHGLADPYVSALAAELARIAQGDAA
jgi:cation transport protein ChaC